MWTEENRVTWRKNCPSVTLSTANPTWIDLRSRDDVNVRGCPSHTRAVLRQYTAIMRLGYLKPQGSQEGLIAVNFTLEQVTKAQVGVEV